MTLLILMTGLFASAWSSDRDPRTMPQIASRTRKVVPTPAVRETALYRWNDETPGESLADTQSAWTPTNDTAEERSALRNVPAGTYLVVSPDGQTDRIVIASAQNLALQTATDHFVTETDGLRQHWIRMTDPAPSLVGHKAVVVVLLDGAELTEKSPISRSVRSQSVTARPTWPNVWSPLVAVLQQLRQEARGPVASDQADSVNR